MTWSAGLAALLVLVCAGCGRSAMGVRHGMAVRRRLGAGRAVVEGRTRRRATVVPAWFSTGLEETALAVDPSTAWRGWQLAAAVASCAGMLAGGPAAGLLFGGAAAVTPVLGWRLLRHRRQARLEEALPAAVEEAARALRSGASLRQALGEAAEAASGQLAGDLARVVAAAGRGASLTAALESWAEERPLDGVTLVVAALCVGAETGGARARALDGVALTLRQRLAVRAEARALATQARVSAAVIALSPLVFCALAAAIDPATGRFLVGDPLGLVFLGAGLALDAAGALWMSRLARVDP